MESVKELLKVVGLQGRLRTAEGLSVEVLVDDARKAYGRVDYLVSPLAGDGCAWVTSDRVELEAQ